ncbi:MAG: AbiU2 domain-containing protein [Planctomycetota bacterium]|jgi:hypothetical protein
MNKCAKEILEKIENQIRNASIRFELVLKLFGSEENLSIINKSAANVFLIFHAVIMEAVVIGLNRLCDPAKDRQGNQNLSIESLRESLQITDHELQKKLLQFECAIKVEVKKLNPFRNKRIAHNDLDTHLEDLHRSIDNNAINESLTLLQEYVNTICLHYENYSVHILNPPYPSGDGPNRLLSLLRKAMDERI